MRGDRQGRLIMLLKQSGEWMTSKELAAALSVSDRTIRSDVEKINNNQMIIESHVRKGYRLLMSLETEKQEDNKQIPDTPGARCVYMIQRLLADSRGLNLTELQGQIYISGYSIENDLKRIRRMIEPYKGLALIRQKERLILEGEEAAKRRFYKDLLVAEVQENFINLNQLATLYHHFDLIEVKDIFQEVSEEYEYSIQESLFPMLIIHAGTSIERMIHANYISWGESMEHLEQTIEYQISSTFFERIANRLHVTVKEGEIGRFALVIMGRKAANYASDHVNFKGDWVNTKKLVLECLETVANLFGIDFREDRDLIAGLKMHIHGLLEREKNNVSLENIFLEEIKQKYPLVFDMSIAIGEYLESKIGAGVCDAESGYIALHLGAASERLHGKRRYKGVAILPHNQSFSDMCVKKINEMFHERLEIVKVLNLFEEKLVKSLDADLILTTFPIVHNLDIMTVSISLFVDSETESNLLKALNQLDKIGFHLEFTTHIGNLIRRECYYQNLDLETREEVIHFLCQKLEAEGIVDQNFVEIVLKREEMSPTSFVNAFAIPHAFGASARNSTIAVAHLKKPISWGSFQVSLVMLFAINEGDHPMIKMFFDWISETLGDNKRLERLCSSCDYDTFMERITG